MFSKIHVPMCLSFFFNAMLSLLFSYSLTGCLANNENALNLLANVFSILSGFLLLVITTSGENASVVENLSTLDIAHQESRFAMRFNKYYFLFLIYLLTLALIFIYFLVSHEVEGRPPLVLKIRQVIGYIISFLACLSFIQSAYIPLKIKELYREKRELCRK